MKNKYIYCVILFLFLLCGCYVQNDKLLPVFRELSSSSLLSKDVGINNIAYIENLECNDSFLVVTDYYEDNMFTLFDTRKETYITRFGKIGQGNYELLPGCDGILIDNNYFIYLKDIGFVAQYDVDSLFVNAASKYKNKHNYKIDYGIFSKILPLYGESKIYLGAGVYKDKYQYCLFDSLNNIKDISHEIYNYDDNGINKYHKYLSNQGVLKRNPMNNMFVYSLFNSSRLDFIYITNEYKIKSIKSHHLYDPEYKQWEGGGLNRVFPTENSIVGYLDLAVSANYVYALFCNRKRYEITNGDRTSSDVISVFDWNGNPVKQIKLPFEIFNLAVNETSKEIYGSYKDDDDNWRIAFFTLP